METKRPSMRKAIDGKCKSCIYDPLGTGTWRAQVQACTSYDCALYSLRPRPAKSTKADVIVSSAA